MALYLAITSGIRTVANGLAQHWRFLSRHKMGSVRIGETTQAKKTEETKKSRNRKKKEA